MISKLVPLVVNLYTNLEINFFIAKTLVANVSN